MRVFISAGEASGDALGAALLAALRRRGVTVDAYGMGGPRMAAEGLRIVRDARELSVVGLVEVLRHLPRLFSLRDALAAEAIAGRPELAILIDVPDFNVRLAKKLKRAGIPVVFYVGPSVWAWRRWRVRAFRRWIDRLLVLFPFEVPVWRAAGVDVVCVGHPLADELPASALTVESRARRALVPTTPRPVVALLPGSRRSELARHLAVMLASAVQLHARGLVERFVLPVAPTLDAAELRAELDALAPGLPVELVLAPAGDPAPRRAALAMASLALVASGTATLETALAGVPQIVVYRVAALTYWIARALAYVRHLGLVNIIAGREVVPELLQHALTAEKLTAAAERLLLDADARRTMLDAYAEVREKLGAEGAGDRAAGAVLELVRRLR